MKKILLLGIGIIGILISSTAQPTIQWQKSFGGSLSDGSGSIKQTTDGGYIFAGATYSNNGDVSGNHGNQDFWVVKINNIGGIQWQKCLGGTYSENAVQIVQTTDGGYILTGNSQSNDGNVTGNHGSSDYWIVKLNSLGNIQWQRSLGGTDIDRAFSIIQTFDGGYIVAGGTKSNDGDVVGGPVSGEDYWIVKLSSTGTIQWQNCIDDGGNEFVESIIQTADGGYILTGMSNSPFANNHGLYDYLVVKLSSTGVGQWRKNYGGSDVEEGTSIKQTSDGGYILAGYSQSNDGNVSGNHGGMDYWIVKIDTVGGIIWQKCLGGTGNEYASSIHQTSDGGYLISGFTSSNDGDVSGNHGSNDYWIVKLDTIGNIQWQKCFGGTGMDNAGETQSTNDGGYIIAGGSESNDGDVSGNHGLFDTWVVKLNGGGTSNLAESFSPNLVKIYPNPINDQFNIEIDHSLIGNYFIIFDCLGKAVLTGTLNSSKSIIPTNNLTSGIYNVTIFNKNSHSFRIIKN